MLKATNGFYLMPISLLIIPFVLCLSLAFLSRLEHLSSLKSHYFKSPCHGMLEENPIDV